MNFLKVAIALCVAVLTAGCSTISPSNIKFEYVDNAARESKVNRSAASVAPASGQTMYIFKRTFGKDEPIARAQECLRYARMAAPDAWSEAFVEAGVQSVWEVARESIVREIQNGNISKEFVLSVVVRAIFDGGRSGYERAKTRIVTLVSSCYNAGGDTWMPNTLADSPDN